MPANSSEMEQCIRNCETCYRACAETSVHCLQKGGRHAEVEHLTLMNDCANICALSADFMVRQSKRHHLTCGACAAICEACAKDCRQMADDQQMQKCAEACERCAESCRRMAA